MENAGDDGKWTEWTRMDLDWEGVDGLMKKHVIVVGGGLAGMACAVALAERGVRVTLLESRFALGGRAGSFEDGESGEGELLDNCQHVLLGCCTNLMDLYRRLGVAEKMAFIEAGAFFGWEGEAV